MIHLIIEGEPVAKGRPRFSVRGGYIRTFTPEKTKNFEEIVGTIARLKIKKPFPKETPLRLQIKFYMPIPKSLSQKKQDALQGAWYLKKPDLDNLIKIVDGLNCIAWEDDCQVCKIDAWKLYDKKPRTEIWINELME